MSTGRRFQVMTYAETLAPDQIAALAAAGRQPDKVDPIVMARDALNRTMLAQDHTLDVNTVREVERKRVIVNDEGTDYRIAGPDEEATGEVITWTALGFERRASDAGMPVLDTFPADGDSVQATVPERETAEGGEVRVRHNLHGEVTVTAEREDGEGVGYLYASPVDDDVIVVHLAPGAARLLVDRDPE